MESAKSHSNSLTSLLAASEDEDEGTDAIFD